MWSFEGDFRRKPVQSLRGASKKEEKDTLLQRAQAEREKREAFRQQNASVTKISAFYRSACVRRKWKSDLRAAFDRYIGELNKVKQSTANVNRVAELIRRLLFFFEEDQDSDRLLAVCQLLVYHKDLLMQLLNRDLPVGLYQVKSLTLLCARYLSIISSKQLPIAVPMRMLEVFTSSDTYKGMKDPTTAVLRPLYIGVMKKGYFGYLKTVFETRVPACFEETTKPPTPLSESLYELLKKPLELIADREDKEFRDMVIHHFCQEFFCSQPSDQVRYFLLPAMACGQQWNFPFVELLHALAPDLENMKANIGVADTEERFQDYRKGTTASPWLLHAFLTLSKPKLDTLSPRDFQHYLQVMKRLIITLPGKKLTSDSGQESDSDDEEMMDTVDYETAEGLVAVKEQCVQVIDSPKFVNSVLISLSRDPSETTLSAVCTLCHTLMSKYGLTVHKVRLLYSLSLNKLFLKNLWYLCVSVCAPTVTGSSTSLLQLLSRGLQMHQNLVDQIVPLLSSFCTLFNHNIITLHDAEFFGDEGEQSSHMPFSVAELVLMSAALRDACLGIIEIAHPESKRSLQQEYVSALKSVGVKQKITSKEELEEKKQTWAFLFQRMAQLVKQLYLRNARRPFCPRNHWLSNQVNILADKPSQIFKAGRFTRQEFGAGLEAESLKDYMDEDGPPLSTTEIRQLTVLTEIPFVVPFQERVKIFSKLILQDKKENQGEPHFFGGPHIQVLIRRNYIYEDAFEKLSPDNEPNLKLRMQVQLVNAVGLDEAGIDGGGIFREFLSELLKTGFDPNRGFFKYTSDKLLYPNPQAKVLVESFTNHFYFLGRMLGKALYSNLLIELPFASFFLSKVLSRQAGNVDIHHLASLDPEMYKNLLFLKNYKGDLSDLGLDFTVANSELGEVSVEELKPGGRNIPVTSSNRIEYIHLMADYRLNRQIRAHTHAFRSGLADVINLEWLRMFDYNELQVLISGAPVPIDIEDLKQHTNYSGGYTADHPVINTFWKVAESLNDVERRQLLKFVTSCSRPPLLGFKDLYPAFCIHYGGHELERLPTASTCMNLLKLPEFKDEETMRNKLLYAIESGTGFELS
ncbi:ubiquitin-protein ligase E3C [Lingula anatina]|uniref:Ubiquitin-protein ligase E3C n=1 Tax=Lingula anatina TaxID=7574 RepID=A0A1S3JYX9_LINAN|nr:ubiquitin-protein ligase E3C [Lingula anatina]|eukprot:XP_013415236.1 ubiquitin-protein ligase E3C [Lingula anatina]